MYASAFDGKLVESDTNIELDVTLLFRPNDGIYILVIQFDSDLSVLVGLQQSSMFSTEESAWNLKIMHEQSQLTN